MAELVDALVSNTCVFTDMPVRLRLRVHKNITTYKLGGYIFGSKKSSKLLEIKKYTLAKLFKGKGKWYVYYKAFNPATGKMHMFKDYYELNKKGQSHKERIAIANARIDAINHSLFSGNTPFVNQVANPMEYASLAESLDYIYEIKKVGIRLRSVQHYQNSIRLMKEYLNGSQIQVQAITPVFAQAYSDWLSTNKKYTNHSHNNQIRSMGTFFNAMIERNIVTTNPFKSVKHKPVDTGTNKPFTDNEKEKLKKYMEKHNPELLIFVKFIYNCGIRPNELVQLKVKDINWEFKNIQIEASTSKNRKQQSTDLPEDFFEEVQKCFYGLNPEFYLFSNALKPGDKQIYRNRVSEAHLRVLKACALDNMGHTMYAWKHTGAIAFIKAGGDPSALMRQFRHHSWEQTNVYLASLGLTRNINFIKKHPKF